MSTRFNKSQISEFKNAFSQFDKDADGIINQEQLATVTRSLGHRDLTPEQLLAITRQADIEGTGNLDTREFMEINKRLTTNLRPSVLETMKTEDLDDTGYVTASQLRQVVEELSDNLIDEEVEDILRYAKIDANGMVRYEEFINVAFA